MIHTDDFELVVTDEILWNWVEMLLSSSSSRGVGISGLGRNRAPVLETLNETLIVIQNWGWILGL